MKKKNTKNVPVKCIVYISTVGDMQHVNQREQRQMKYISEYAKGNNIEIVKVLRRNVLGQLDVNKHFDLIVQMIREGFADGILIANMQFIARDIEDACKKIAKISKVGAAIYSVDDGKLMFQFNDCRSGYKDKLKN